MPHRYYDTSDLNAPYDQFPMHEDLGVPSAERLMSGFSAPRPLPAPGNHVYKSTADLNARWDSVPLQGAPEEYLTPAHQRALASGGRVSSISQDLTVTLNQVPRWAWFTVGGLALVLAIVAARKASMK